MGLLEFAKEIGLDPIKVASTCGGEWHSACPKCGGEDRFIIQPVRRMKNCEGFFQCRQCEVHGDSIEFCKLFFGMSFKDAVEKVNGAGATIALNPIRSNKLKAYDKLRPPSKKWQERALSFVNWANAELLKHDDVIVMLAKRGIDKAAIDQYKIGYCSQEFFCPRDDWGLLPDKNDNGEDRKVWLPIGIVIPAIERDGSILRLKIRRTSWQPDDRLPKYIAISGSMNGLNIVGDANKGLMAVVESELDAFALHHACSDLLFCIAIGSNNKDPDNVTDYYAKNKRLIVIPDNDEGGETMRKKWTQLYAHARSLPTPIGKDVGEAVQQGLDIRAWLLENNK